MKWEKKGLVYGPRNERSWAWNSAMTPTPVQPDPDVIRVYAGFRDEAGSAGSGLSTWTRGSRRGCSGCPPSRSWISAARARSTTTASFSATWSGTKSGCTCSTLDFQLVARAKFLAFSGLAISSDNGTTFERFSAAPVMDRADEGFYIRAVHSVRVENGTWRSGMRPGTVGRPSPAKPYPQYHIRYLETRAVGPLPASGARCVEVRPPEYRIGRPRVYRFRERHMMRLYPRHDHGRIPGGLCRVIRRPSLGAQG